MFLGLFQLRKTSLACASVALRNVKLGKSPELSRKHPDMMRDGGTLLLKTYLPKLKVHLYTHISKFI